MAKYLTFDLGTTLYKVALFDAHGQLLDFERVAPQNALGEIVPEDFRAALTNAAAALRGRQPDGFRDVVAVSFASQANTFLLLDEANQPLTNLIPWTARASLGKPLHRISSHPQFRLTTGMPRFSPYLGLAKAMEIHKLHQETFQRAKGFAYLSDYFTFWMTGIRQSEAGVAGLSGALDIRTLDWWQAALGPIPIEWMPSVARAATDLGPIRSDLADTLGLSRDCRFVMGCLDQYAGAIGTGSVHPGSTSETTGTVLAAVQCGDRFESELNAEVYQGPAFQAGWFFQMSFSSTSANLLERYQRTLPHRPSFDELSRQAGEAASSDSLPVILEPVRDGEPIADPFIHVRPDHSAGQTVRAIMLAVAQALKRQVLSLSEHMPTTIRSAGGAARSDVWLQIKADTLGATMEAIDCPEPTSLGAAMLAARAVTGRSLGDLADEWVRVRKVFVPET